MDLHHQRTPQASVAPAARCVPSRTSCPRQPRARNLRAALLPQHRRAHLAALGMHFASYLR